MWNSHFSKKLRLMNLLSLPASFCMLFTFVWATFKNQIFNIILLKIVTLDFFHMKTVQESFFPVFTQSRFWCKQPLRLPLHLKDNSIFKNAAWGFFDQKSMVIMHIALPFCWWQPSFWKRSAFWWKYDFQALIPLGFLTYWAKQFTTFTTRAAPQEYPNPAIKQKLNMIPCF